MRASSLGDPKPSGGARLARIVITLLAVGLLLAIMAPFAAALVLAAALAGAFRPWFEKLGARLGGRRRLAAALLTIGVLLVVVVPLVVVGIVVGHDVADAVHSVRATVESEGVAGLVARVPAPLRSLAERVVAELPERGAELQKLAPQQGGRAAAALWQGVAATARTVLKTALMAIAFFFLLVDGESLAGWLVRVAPFPAQQTRRVLNDFRQVAVSVLVSTVATSAVQAVVALVGYLIAGAPRVVLATFLTFVVAFIPAVGAGSVVVAMAGILALSGKIGAAIFLAIWGVTAVGLSDNVVKPLLIKQDVEIHSAVIFFALLGGLAVFGPVGLLAGPLIVAFFLAIVRMDTGEDAVKDG